ncbi:hypothetical protein ZEAMMB73_Zm00001d041222 [Zea mays]|uniref:Uncharacterized protein n=1 Tax=Zea mays TaxID=4577 RepID=A0A1D6MV50_MAIZE|nr:hypothetical protein ZEAMMB73_Zm00001d041222 [Zea mays]ONM32699.1 hypothetical protein ZEAMMB73_Zm00001d041222 [Zea mays]
MAHSRTLAGCGDQKVLGHRHRLPHLRGFFMKFLFRFFELMST